MLNELDIREILVLKQAELLFSNPSEESKIIITAKIKLLKIILEIED